MRRRAVRMQVQVDHDFPIVERHKTSPTPVTLPHVLETLHIECIDSLLPVLKLAFCMRHMQSVLRVCVRLCTDPGQLLLQGLLGGLRAAVQLGALLTHTLSQPLYSVPLCLQQLTRLAHAHTYTYTHTCTHTHAQYTDANAHTRPVARLCTGRVHKTKLHTDTYTHTHMGQRR